MDQNYNHNTESTSEELNFFGELRTIPACWDLSSIMDNPDISNNGRPKQANTTHESSGGEEHQHPHNGGMIAFEDWYLGPYLDREDDPGQWSWCAY